MVLNENHEDSPKAPEHTERVEKEGGSKLKILTPSLFYYRSFLCILVIFFCFFFKGEETQITSEAEREEIV